MKEKGHELSLMPLLVSESRGVPYRKFAVTDVSLVMVTVVGLAVPVIAPDQPIQGEPADGVAVSVTTVPAAIC